MIVIKWVIKIVGLTILIPLVMLLYWYFSSFYPHLSEMKTIVKCEEKVISGVSDIYKLAVQAEGLKAMRIFAARQAYRELVFEKEPKTTAEWHLNTALWYFSSYLHFNENEIFSLWASLAYAGKKGLQNSSIDLFGKELYQLNLRQKAQLIATVKAPSRYKLGSTTLKKRVDTILGESE